MVQPRTKSAPALLYDLLGFDPREVASSDRRQRCEHAYVTVADRSHLPSLDEIPNSATVWTSVSVCQRCRCHVELSISFQESTTPCPHKGAPLHFLEWQTPSPEDSQRATPLHTFICALSACRAVLTARVRKPILDQAYEAILTEPTHLKRRYQVAFAQHPSLQEMAPIQALATLRSYIKGALGPDRSRTIPARNKRFMYALGDDARELLIKLGFAYSRNMENSDLDNWLPPGYNTEISDDTLEILLDCRDELTLLMQQRPQAEWSALKEQDQQEMHDLRPSTRDMERLLGTLDYPKRPNFRGQTLPDSNAYRLGCLSDFSDDLIAYAYDTLSLVHPQDSPLAFDHLRKIAAERQSESLQLKATMLESEGQLSREALNKAYYELGFENLEYATSAPDAELLGAYQARIPDIGPAHQQQLKEALRTVANWRQSHFLKQACAERIETLEQALLYLDATAVTSDDFIITLYAAKSSDAGPGDERPQDALRIIAKERNSPGLQAYLEQGEMPAPYMDIREAYLMFGIEGGSQVDDQIILDAFSIGISEAPGRTKDYRNALSVIARERNSPSLHSALHDAATQTAQFKVMSPPTDPRGIGNLANTCYMNTLFQWFFYIKPVRERVLNFDRYKEDPSSQAVFKDKVGDMNVGKKEIQRAQRFVRALEGLYRDMITIQKDYPVRSSNNPLERADYPTPSIELARLTLAPVTKGSARRRSTISSIPGSARTLSSPKLERFPSNRLGENNADVANNVAITDSPAEHRLHGYVDQKDLITEVNDRSETDLTPQIKTQQVEVGSDGGSLDLASNQAPDQEMDTLGPDAPETASQAADNAIEIPPPVPPRNRMDSVDDLASMEQLATQQDVSEAIENMLHQFSWAFKPLFPGSNQSTDVISKLFYGKESMVTMRRESSSALEYRKIVASETFYNIFVPLSQEVDQENIYSALGNALDRDDLTDGTGYNYRTLKELPDILQIRVHRVDFDKALGRPVKNRTPLILDEEIFMDRFIDDEVMLEKRRVSWELKEKLDVLRRRKITLTETSIDSTIPEAFSSLKTYLSHIGDSAEDLDLKDLNISDELTQDLDDYATKVQREIDMIDTKISKLEAESQNLFEKGGKLKYRLHSVFVHTGDQTGSGHWYIYIYDPATQIWRWFNDGQVLEVKDVKDIFSPRKDAHGHSTLIAYVRADHQQDIMDSVRREQPDDPPQGNLHQEREIDGVDSAGFHGYDGTKECIMLSRSFRALPKFFLSVSPPSMKYRVKTSLCQKQPNLFKVSLSRNCNLNRNNIQLDDGQNFRLKNTYPANDSISSVSNKIGPSLANPNCPESSTASTAIEILNCHKMLGIISDGLELIKKDHQTVRMILAELPKPSSPYRTTHCSSYSPSTVSLITPSPSSSPSCSMNFTSFQSAAAIESELNYGQAILHSQAQDLLPVSVSESRSLSHKSRFKECFEESLENPLDGCNSFKQQVPVSLRRNNSEYWQALRREWPKHNAVEFARLNIDRLPKLLEARVSVLWDDQGLSRPRMYRRGKRPSRCSCNLGSCSARLERGQDQCKFCHKSFCQEHLNFKEHDCFSLSVDKAMHLTDRINEMLSRSTPEQAATILHGALNQLENPRPVHPASIFHLLRKCNAKAESLLGDFMEKSKNKDYSEQSCSTAERDSGSL